MSRIKVAYDYRDFEGSKNIKTDVAELDIEGSITETIIARHIKARTSHNHIEVKDWVFINDDSVSV